MALHPSSAKAMAEIHQSRANSQFVLYGNIDDWVTFTENEDQNLQCLSLKDFLTRVMFAPFEVVLTYDRGHGIRTAKGSNLFFNFLKTYDTYHHTSYSTGYDNGIDNALPKDPKKALAIVDRFIRNGLVRTGVDKSGKAVANQIGRASCRERV